MHDRDQVACHLCFRDKALQEWIKEEAIDRGQCPWCGRRGHLISLIRLGEPFREVASIYVPDDGSEFHPRGEPIGYMIDNDWQVFSKEIQVNDLVQDLTVAILDAHVRDKDRLDYPDFTDLFLHQEPSLEAAWDDRVYAVLTGKPPVPSEASSIASDIAHGLPDQMSVAFDDLATTYDAGTILYRARIHDDRTLTKRFDNSELGAPPPGKAKSGRASQKGEAVLYLATNKSTALAEVRPWKGAAVALADVQNKRSLMLVDLSRPRRLKSPFFVELLQWQVELAGLLWRLGQDMSRPIMPHEQEVLYKPTQLLASLIKSNGYHGCIYPSAMGPGKNIVLFDPNDAQVTNVNYVRVNRLAYFSVQLDPNEAIYEEGPFDFAISRE